MTTGEPGQVAAAVAIGATANDFAGLKKAVEALQNGVRGYDAAAERTEDAAVTALMRELRESRRKVLADVVRVAASETAYEPEDHEGTVPGALHRGWLAVKSVLGSDASVIEAAKTGEDEAISDLEEAIDAGLPTPVDDALRTALEDVRTARQRLDARASS